MSALDIIIGEYRLVLTCRACPEQYDVFKGEQRAGYLRLRHGRFTAHVPDCRGPLVYAANPKGDGSFTNDAERQRYLQQAVEAIDDAT